MKLFTENGRFLRGNLHTHTTISDGKVSAQECIDRYRSEGYDFLAITDHRKRFGGFVQWQDGERKMAGTALENVLEGGDTVWEALHGTEDYRFLVIPSTEFDRNFIKEGPEYAYHITGIGLEHFIPQTNEWSPQQIVDAIHAENGFCTLAHPIWSLMTVEQCMELQRYDATEIYNTVSEVYSGRGTSDLYVDMMASRGRYVLLTAVDDTHFYDRDPFGGWVMVQAEKNNWPSIHEALLSGRFYSTQGPLIEQIETLREEDEAADAPSLAAPADAEKKAAGRCLTVKVKCSPAASVRFMTNALYNGHRTAYPAEGQTYLTEASYTLSDSERFVRIEVRDAAGKTAWSNIVVK